MATAHRGKRKTKAPLALQLIQELWNIGNYWTQIAVQCALVIALIWPFVGLAIALYAHTIFWKIILIELLPFLVLVFLIAAFEWPLGAGAVLVTPEGKKTAHRLMIALGVEDAFLLYLCFVPVHANPGLALAIPFLLFGIVIFWSIPMVWVRRVLVGICVFLIFYITVFLFQTDLKNESVSASNDKPPTATITVSQAQVITASKPVTNQPFVITIPLLGENVPSQSVDLDRDIPGGWDFSGQGPKETLAHFADGTVYHLWENVGKRHGRIYYTGPKGQVVTITCTPPPNKAEKKEVQTAETKNSELQKNPASNASGFFNLTGLYNPPRPSRIFGTVIYASDAEPRFTIQTQDGKEMSWGNTAEDKNFIVYYAPVIYHNQFFQLRNLQPGDEVEVVVDANSPRHDVLKIIVTKGVQEKNS